MMVFDYTMMVVTVGTLLLGSVSGALGVFAVLRKQSLLGDAISHASFPGIGLAFLLVMTKSPWVLLGGAIVSGWVGTLLVMVVVNHTHIKQDTALGIVLSVFFGFGLVLLTLIQKLPTASQSGLSTFLFGSASTLLMEDLVMMGVLGGLTLGMLGLFWKEFKVLTFDREFAHTVGFPVRLLEVVLTTLIVFSIVIGLQTVGVVLMSAMVIAPAAAARQLTDRLFLMVVLSGIMGAFSGMIGSLISGSVRHMPTGPTIVLVMSGFVLISLLMAPNRGLIWSWWRQRRASEGIREQTMLTNLLLFSESQTDPFYAHDLAALTSIGRGPARAAMRSLREQGLVVNPDGNRWALTQRGLVAARALQKQVREDELDGD